MAYRSTWTRSEDTVLDPGDFAPEPVPEQDRAAVLAVIDEQWAMLGPAHDPASAEYWDRFEDMAAAMAEEEPAGFPAQELTGGLSTASRGLGRAGLDDDELTRVFDPALVDALEAVGRVRSQLDALGFSLALEASRRGLHAEVGLSLTDWLKVRCSWLSRSEANQIKAVVEAAQEHWGAPLADAVRHGTTGLHRAAKVARTITRLAASLEPDQQHAYAAIATKAATDPNIKDADLGKVCKKLLIDLLDEKPKDEVKQTAHEQRCVIRRPLGQGMVRYTMDVPESDAALIDGILDGPLAKPNPDEDGNPDERSAGNRRYDALQMVLNRGLSNPGAPPSSARASVMVTVKADPETGRSTGAAFAHTGQVFDAATAGRFACIGDVTPIALGEYGEPLNLGRTERLATPGQFKALMVRDGQCTYPGCSVPGTWCDAHHLVWWCRMGNTDIAFLVLLCPRHHTLVHEKDLMATVTGSVVTWDI